MHRQAGRQTDRQADRQTHTHTHTHTHTQTHTNTHTLYQGHIHTKTHHNMDTTPYMLYRFLCNIITAVCVYICVLCVSCGGYIAICSQTHDQK